MPYGQQISNWLKTQDLKVGYVIFQKRFRKSQADYQNKLVANQQ